MAGGRPRVLFVDDEQRILDAHARGLRTQFEVSTASSGVTGVEVLKEKGPFAVVVSDLRMPEMDGVTFLQWAREIAPDAVRVLFTGQPDLENAIAAVNEGSIYRLLIKPCPVQTLTDTLKAAAEQHRLITAERELLEQTLRGSVQALTEVLAFASPAAFGRAVRTRKAVNELLAYLSLAERWPVEVAAMLSQIACVTLPSQTLEKLYRGEPVSDAEQAMVARLPTLTEQLLANIPRLEPVREILRFQNKHYDGTGEPPDPVRGDAIPWGARVLKAVLDLDVLEAQGLSTSLAFDTLRGRTGWYDSSILEALAQARGNARKESVVKELALSQIKIGMVFAGDVKTQKGLLLIARGQTVTPSLIERIKNFSLGMNVKEPVRVIVPDVPAPK